MTRYYHGGIPGLRVGDILQPPPPGQGPHLVDGCPVCEARKRGEPADYDRNHRFDRIYVTTDKRIARFFAAGYPDGDLYQAEPLGELEPDPEHPDSFAVEAARIRWVVELRVRIHKPQELRRWADLALGGGR